MNILRDVPDVDRVRGHEHSDNDAHVRRMRVHHREVRHLHDEHDQRHHVLKEKFRGEPPVPEHVALPERTGQDRTDHQSDLHEHRDVHDVKGNRATQIRDEEPDAHEKREQLAEREQRVDHRPDTRLALQECGRKPGFSHTPRLGGTATQSRDDCHPERAELPARLGT